ncbi:MAG: response regulator [Pseudomonadota bacterium]
MATAKSEEQGKQNLVVFVDDIPQMLKIVSRMFDEMGVTGRCFNDPDAALEFVRDHKEAVRLLITDQSMQPKTGLQLVDELQSQGVNPPVVLATSVQSSAALDEYQSRGITALLRKPFTLQELEQVISNFAKSA